MKKFKLIKEYGLPLLCGMLIGGCTYKVVNNDDTNEDNNIAIITPVPSPSIAIEVLPSPTPTITPTEVPTEDVISKEEFEKEDERREYHHCDVYFNQDTPIYNTINGNELSSLEIYSKAFEIYSVDGWSFIDIGDALVFVESKNITELPKKYIELDISDQNVKLFMDGKEVVDSKVVTGKDSTPTREGCFEIFAKNRNRYLTGPGYKSYVNYFMPFDGGIGLHDASWRSEFGGEIYRENGSHGCVNMPYDDVKTIYENVEVGTKVLVHK